MYSKSCIVSYMKEKKFAPKVYIEQRMSVGDNDNICYYVYTMLGEGQQVSVEDIDDLVIIPDTREKIIGDFNCTDKTMSVLKVVKEIINDQEFGDVSEMPVLKTPVWSYKNNWSKLVA